MARLVTGQDRNGNLSLGRGLILALTREWGRIRGRGEFLRGANFIGADGLMSDEDNDRRSDLDKLGERIARARGEEPKPEPGLSSGASAG
ncbi:MAG: hypothetical protein AAFX52_15980, partial [Pseudomonadota bacterium]